MSRITVKKVSCVGALFSTLANVLDKITISNKRGHLHQPGSRCKGKEEGTEREKVGERKREKDGRERRGERERERERELCTLRTHINAKWVTIKSTQSSETNFLKCVLGMNMSLWKPSSVESNETHL